MSDRRERLKTLLVEKALTHGRFILASGAESSYYLDVRRVSMDPEGAHLIASLFCELLETGDVAAVGGPVLGAAPIVGALAAESFRRGRPLPVFLVRKEAKGHGTGRLIEGNFPEGRKVALVEDVVTAGGSVLSAVDAVAAAGSQVTRILAVVDRGAGGREALEARGISFTALFSVSELLEAPRG
jgi:orotate phosphoribosyltransferase